jgi:hypothetical protein
MMVAGGADGIYIPRTTSQLQELETIRCPSTVINLKQFKPSLCNRSSCWLFNSVSEFHTRPSSFSWPHKNQNTNIHNCGTGIAEVKEGTHTHIYCDNLILFTSADMSACAMHHTWLKVREYFERSICHDNASHFVSQFPAKYSILQM